MKKVLKWLGAFIFIAVIGIQSVSASSLNDELAIETSNISVEQQDSRNSVVPLNTEGMIQGYNLNPDFTAPMGINTIWTWDYVGIGSSLRRGNFTFVPTNNGRVVIRATSPRWDDYNYFNISNRGYVYLDRRENAREFVVREHGNNGHFTIMDVRTGEELGIYRQFGSNNILVTIGSGTIPTTWTFTQR